MNNDHIDDETQEQLLLALEKAKEARSTMEQKREEKHWKDIDVPLKLMDALKNLTKDDLQNIRSNLKLKNLSSLNKQDLTAELLHRIPDAVENVLMSFDHDRYSIVKRIVNQGGYFSAPILDPGQLEYFRNCGIVFSGLVHGDKVLAIPEEIVQKIQKINDNGLDDIVQRNSEWIILTRGLLYYYGTLNLNQLEKMLPKFTGAKLKVDEYVQVIFNSLFYHTGIRHDESSNSFSNDRVWDSKRVIREHQLREDLDFFPFTKKQLLKAGEPEFVERNLSYKKFMNHITDHYDVSRDKADMITEECVYAIRIGESPSNMLQYIQSQFEFDRLDEIHPFMEKLTELSNNTRQWFLKGHTSEELFKVEKNVLQPLPQLSMDRRSSAKQADVINIASKKKVGRNEPCPCGSGRKYKKCCGK